MKFSVITPCKNSRILLEETINSVLNQTLFLNNKAELEYIIIDGNSNDGSKELVKKYQKKFKCIKFISEKDDGMYDALIKGLKICTGDVVSYINAGDYYDLRAFNLVKNIFEENKKVNWLTGNKIIYNENSEIIDSTAPYCYRNNLIISGVYGNYLPFIQQESTFWRAKLINLINFSKLKKLKLAGDYYIWFCFAQKYYLNIIQSYLGGFKIHENQLSSKKINQISYRDEVNYFIKKKTIKDYFYIIIDIVPWLILKYSNRFFGKISSHYKYYRPNKSWSSNENEIFVWCCDVSNNRGEGKLAIEFIKEEIYTKYKEIHIRNNFKTYVNILNLKINTTNKLNLNFVESYISPFFGIFYLWYKFILGKKVSYVNFLPLWNTFLILFLPPGTILGPITGSLYQGKITSTKILLRKYLLPLLYKINSFFLQFRSGKIIFSTSLLKEFFSKKQLKDYNFGYILKCKIINKQAIKNLKKYDLIIYYRIYDTKSNTFIKNIIKYFETQKRIKFKYFGHPIDRLTKNYLGVLDNNSVIKILSHTKYSIISEENVESYYARECIENNVKIFCHKDSIKKINLKNIISINFNDYEESIKIIEENLKH
jgi:glycosyltransferase involved in cell wall biosynthesis